MNLTIVLFLAVLLSSGVVLMWEARTGQFTAKRSFWNVARAGLFFLATIAGGTLLIRSMGGTVLLALAFIPVTFLSLMRLVALTRIKWVGIAPTVSMALALFLGITVCLQVVPEPIDEGVFLEQIFHGGGDGSSDSIDPSARRSVRV